MLQGVAHHQTATSESRRLDIQGLRAVAVILVVAFHAGLPVPGGFIGVDVFLVISGFVIMGMLMRELERTGTICFRNFYSRRIKRLLPALALLTTTVAALSLFFGSSFGSQQAAAKTGLGATFFSANLVLLRQQTGYFAPEAALNPLLHTWTLSVEEQVYLVFPALLLGGWFVGRRLLRTSKRGTAVMLTLVAMLSFLLCVLLSFGRLSGFIDDPFRYAFYSSVTRIWEFAIGAGLALAAPRLKRIPPKVAMALGLVGACAIGAGAFTITGLTPYPGLAVLLPVLGAAAIITAGFRPSTGVPRLLATRPMAKVGDLSYSWYLWHWPLIVFGAILWPSSPWVLVVLGVLSLVPAWLSTVFLENPIRGNQAIKGRRVVVLAEICTVVPTLACLGLWAGANASWSSEALADMQAQVGPMHAVNANGCDWGVPRVGPCEWNPSASGPHVYIVGDSSAAQFGEALIGASSEVGSPLTARTAFCFFLDTPVYRDGVEDLGCGDYVKTTVNWLTHQKPGLVVVASLWDVAIDLPNISMEYGGDDSAMATTVKQKDEVVVSSLESTIGRLRDAGHQVVLLLPTPHFEYNRGEFDTVEDWEQRGRWYPSECPNVVALSSTASCGDTVPEAQVIADQADVAQALTTVAEATGSTTLDLRSQFCSEGVCRTNVGDRWMFRDGFHITVAESDALAPTFAELLRHADTRTRARSR